MEQLERWQYKCRYQKTNEEEKGNTQCDWQAEVKRKTTKKTSKEETKENKQGEHRDNEIKQYKIKII